MKHSDLEEPYFHGQCRRIVVGDVGHWPHLERQDAFIQRECPVCVACEPGPPTEPRVVPLMDARIARFMALTGRRNDEGPAPQRWPSDLLFRWWRGRDLHCRFPRRACHRRRRAAAGASRAGRGGRQGHRGLLRTREAGVPLGTPASSRCRNCVLFTLAVNGPAPSLLLSGSTPRRRRKERSRRRRNPLVCPGLANEPTAGQ